MNFTFTITSQTHGTFVVIAPERFRAEIEARTWRVSKQPHGRFNVLTNIRRLDGKYSPIAIWKFIWELSGKPSAPQIDHADRNTFNNSEENLRSATNQQNSRNVIKRSNSSGAIGVSWNKSSCKWQAKIRVGEDGYQLHLGFFDDINDAIKERDRAAVEHHGEFAVLNTKTRGIQ